MNDLEVRKYLRDFLNGEYTKFDLMREFNLEECKCSNIELQEDMFDTEESIGIGYICEQCKKDL